MIPFGLDDGSALDEDFDEEPEMGPMPRERSAPFAAGEGGKGIDEVEVSFELKLTDYFMLITHPFRTVHVSRIGVVLLPRREI